MTMNLHGRTAVITGAGSGIGRALAMGLADKGCHLALADINLASLAETAALAARPGLRVSHHQLDIASRAEVAALPELVLAEHPGVDLLFNNAGVALGGRFEVLSEDEFDWLFEINFHGLVRLTRAFLPLLHRSTDARLVNVSSLFGLIAPPEQTAYAASKFAVRGFSQALTHELAGSTVGVTTVHPGGVATAIALNARIPRAVNDIAAAEQAKRAFNRLLTMPPATAADIILRAVEHRKTRVIVGRSAQFMALVERIAPVSYWPILMAITKRKRK